MNKRSTDQLYVNLSASQTRKRLKGHGFGVKRVASVDRNQAVIRHTATGQHLRELRSLLSDVLVEDGGAPLDAPIANLRNLGASSAAWLAEVGIHSRPALEETGPVMAYRLVKRAHPQVSINLLWALYGALSDLDWRDIPPSEKERLRRDAEL